MGLYALDEQYTVATWYDYQGANDLWVGTDLMLDLSRHIINSDAYVFQGIAFPKGTDTQFGFQGTFSGSLNLIPYSYIVGLNGYTVDQIPFNVRLYDKGAQTDLYYGQFGWYPTICGSMQYGSEDQTGGDVLTTPDRPFGTYFFRDPLIVLPPGTLQIQITNASPVDFPSTAAFQQQTQLLFLVAAPKNTQTLSTQRVQTASDQTGVQSLGALASFLPT